MHTILGAGGPVSNELAKLLISQGKTVKLVSRRLIETIGNVTWQKADLKNYQELLSAAKSSEIIYMCAGLKYDKKVWQAEWPVIMQNLINLAKETQARLIFFDNVYMYGKVNGLMTENTPYNPVSVKGEVRAKTANMLMDEVKAGNITASMARAADFYGAMQNSFFDTMVLDKYAKGKSAQWLGNPHSKHSFTYIPDAAKGMALLGDNPESDNQIWHLPTAPSLTGIELMKLATEAFKINFNYSTINKTMLQLLGIFNKLVGETTEMYYQYKYDYQFNSDKFENAFSVKPIDYKIGIKILADTMHQPK